MKGGDYNMVEVIHEHDTHRADNTSGSLVLLIGILLAVAIFLLFFYGIGRGMLNSGTGVNTPQINVPERVNVDVNNK